MSGLRDTTPSDAVAVPGGAPFADALGPHSMRFTLSSFARRMKQHLVVYVSMLVAAIGVCMFVLAPLQTLLILTICTVVVGVAASCLSSSRQRFQRLIQGGVAVSYIAGAVVLLIVFETFWHRG